MHACAAVPKLKALWASYYQAYDVDVIVVPTLPTTARPIDDVEPYMTFNGRKVSCCQAAWLGVDFLYTVVDQSSERPS